MLKITDGVIVEMTAEEEEAIRGIVNEYNAQKARQPLEREEVFDLLAKELVNTVNIPDQTSLRMKSYYPTFDKLAESGYTAAKQGYKFRDGDDLYKTAQDNVTFQAQYRPGTGTESLYTHIDEAHAGALEDPIPAVANMEYEYGKYYSEGETIYICKRGGVSNPEEMYGQKVTLQYLPSALIGQYFEVAK